jgi:hypothetical protein
MQQHWLFARTPYTSLASHKQRPTKRRSAAHLLRRTCIALLCFSAWCGQAQIRTRTTGASNTNLVGCRAYLDAELMRQKALQPELGAYSFLMVATCWPCTCHTTRTDRRWGKATRAATWSWYVSKGHLFAAGILLALLG